MCVYIHTHTHTRSQESDQIKALNFSCKRNFIETPAHKCVPALYYYNKSIEMR